MILPTLCIAPSGKKGRGVFTTKNIAAHKIIEISPVIPLNRKDRKMVEKTRLSDYIFEWGKDHSKACIALGPVYMKWILKRSLCISKRQEQLKRVKNFL